MDDGIIEKTILVWSDPIALVVVRGVSGATGTRLPLKKKIIIKIIIMFHRISLDLCFRPRRPIYIAEASSWLRIRLGARPGLVVALSSLSFRSSDRFDAAETAGEYLERTG